MNEKGEVTKFREGDTKEHEGVTYVAVRQKGDETCEGCDKLLARYRTGARNGVQRRAARR